MYNKVTVKRKTEWFQNFLKFFLVVPGYAELPHGSQLYNLYLFSLRLFMGNIMRIIIVSKRWKIQLTFSKRLHPHPL